MAYRPTNVLGSRSVTVAPIAYEGHVGVPVGNTSCSSGRRAQLQFCGHFDLL